MKKPTILMILDGFGFNKNEKVNAILKANTPNLDDYFKIYPHDLIHASGIHVGLPDGQMGNSEVGHLNIGAGRVVYQELTRITKAIEEKTLFHNQTFLDAIENAKQHNSSLHLLGLLSDGGVHSHNTHLYALLRLCKQHDLKKVYIHAFLDGRDVPPSSAKSYLVDLEKKLKEIGVGKIATLSGRYYAMDRDNRFDRVKLAYDAMALGKGHTASSAIDAIDTSYDQNIVDEFVVPTVILDHDQPTGIIEPMDSLIMFNFRPDRAREITRSLVDEHFTGFERENGYFRTHYVCMTQYDESMPNVSIAYPPQKLSNTLGEYISNLGLKQLRIAETEKYAHVTFFFNGGVETPYKGEDRILIPSPKVATYDLKPEMSACEVTDQLIEQIHKNQHDLIIVNFANCDMVGHTGKMDAAIKAVECIDECVKKVVEATLSVDGQILLTADHGNADEMLDESGHTITAHSTNPVPIMLIGNESFSLKEGKLADIAPTLLHLMDIEQPDEMTGTSLLIPSSQTAHA